MPIAALKLCVICFFGTTVMHFYCDICCQPLKKQGIKAKSQKIITLFSPLTFATNFLVFSHVITKRILQIHYHIMILNLISFWFLYLFVYFHYALGQTSTQSVIMGWRVLPNSLMGSRLVNHNNAMLLGSILIWPSTSSSHDACMHNIPGWFGESFTGGSEHKTLTDWANGESFTFTRQWITHDWSVIRMIYGKSRW
jgi:hypothetical protein